LILNKKERQNHIEHECVVSMEEEDQMGFKPSKEDYNDEMDLFKRRKKNKEKPTTRPTIRTRKQKELRTMNR